MNVRVRPRPTPGESPEGGGPLNPPTEQFFPKCNFPNLDLTVVGWAPQAFVRATGQFASAGMLVRVLRKYYGEKSSLEESGMCFQAVFRQRPHQGTQTLLADSRPVPSCLMLASCTVQPPGDFRTPVGRESSEGPWM